MKIRFYCSTHDIGSEESEEWEVDDDTTHDALLKEAEQYFWETKEPNWWYEKV